MANILFIVDEYYPNISPTAKCADNVIKKIKENHDVTIICFEDMISSSGKSKNDIIRISTPFMKSTKWINYKYDSSKNIKKKFYGTLKFLLRLSKYIKFILSDSSIDMSLVKKILSAIEECNNLKDVQYVIPVCFPFEGLVAANLFKKNNINVKVFPFMFDPFSDNTSLHKFPLIKSLRYKVHREVEDEIFRNSDQIFVINHLLKSKAFIENMYLNNKLVITEHPVLIKPTTPSYAERKKIVNITYTGALYSSIRRPTYLMEMLTIINNYDFEFEMNMYSFGDGQRLLFEYRDKLKEKLVLHGKVPYNEAQKAINRADILISIGNSIKNQTPSKIFEYISFGKPIVHIYTSEEDLVVETLNKYPLALCIKEDVKNTQKNAKILMEFCEENLNKSISFDQCSQIFIEATPEYVARQFEKYID